ncbi:MAG: hybrid sensor histidine kinase/response regulator, partial [Alistipes senegalensis]
RDNIRIDADESAMNKILNNLLHNALKYAESYIEVNVRSHDGTATVSITNDGEPISPEQRSEIFKPFVQYDKSPGSRSFGIGLSLARSLAEMHAGTRTRRRHPPHHVRTDASGRGAPSRNGCRAGAAGAAGPVAAAAAARGGQPGTHGLSQTQARRRLSGHRRTRGRKGRRRIAGTGGGHRRHGHRPARHERHQLCRTISSDFDLSHIPVIVTSAISDTATKIACMEAGASTYIEKPFGLDYLEACIRAILDKRARLKKSYQNTQEPLDPNSSGCTAPTRNSCAGSTS